MSTENELHARRTVMKLTHELADLCRDAGERYKELRAELGVGANDIIALVLDQLPPDVRAEIAPTAETFPLVLEPLYFMISSIGLPDEERRKRTVEILGPNADMMSTVGAQFGMGGIGASMQEAVERLKEDPYYRSGPMKRLIMRMFKDAQTISATDTPAIECQVILRNGSPLSGALSTTPEGTLKMLVPMKNPDGVEVMTECFFEYEDALTVIVKREMKMEAPPVIRLS